MKSRGSKIWKLRATSPKRSPLAGFFTVEVWSSVGLIRYLVFFVIDLPARRVEIAGIAPIPDGLWMQQVARNLIDDFSGFLRGKRFLIHDRDPLFKRAFCERVWVQYSAQLQMALCQELGFAGGGSFVARIWQACDGLRR